jgi:hypothetical protein
MKNWISDKLIDLENWWINLPTEIEQEKRFLKRCIKENPSNLIGLACSLFALTMIIIDWLSK